MKIVAIIQARMASTRFPGKVLEDLAGEPMLARVFNRTRRAKTVDAVVVATTTQQTDDVIVHLCETQGWPCFRGSEEDVLDRYYQATLAFKADAIARITADCPLIEPGVIDRVINEFRAYYPKVDYVSNTLERTFPRGLDVEITSLDALRKAWREAVTPASREHVTPYIWHHRKKFKLRNVHNNVDYSYMRWTVDTIEDLTFVRKIYNHFENDTFAWRDVLHLLAVHPEWMEINQHIRQKLVQ